MQNGSKNNDYHLAVIIATSKQRTNLLFERSLLSVYKQKNVNPMILIVDDNQISPGMEYSTEYNAIKIGIEELRQRILKPAYEQMKKGNDTIKSNSRIFFQQHFYRILGQRDILVLGHGTLHFIIYNEPGTNKHSILRF